MPGDWKINIQLNFLPSNIAIAIDELNKEGSVKYQPIAYLGSQIVNGINHAILTEQTFIVNTNKNITVLIFNEASDGAGITLVSIKQIIKNEHNIQINPTTKIPEKLLKLWKKAFEGFVGSRMIPLVLLGSKQEPEKSYVFFAEAKDPYLENNDNAMIIAISDAGKYSIFTDIFADEIT